jgi:hypothetical protein
MSWFLVDAFDRLERFVRDCPHYQGDVNSQIMVVASYFPLFTWVFVFVIAAYDRTAFHVLLTTGLFIADWLTWLLRLLWTDAQGPTVDDATMCATAFLRQRPCHEAVIAWFVFVYYLAYDLYFTHKVRRMNVLCLSLPRVALKFVVLFFYSVLSSWSQTYLRLFNANEVAIGATMGVVMAICISQVHHLILPNKPTWKKKMTFFCCLIDEGEQFLGRAKRQLRGLKRSDSAFQ